VSKAASWVRGGNVTSPKGFLAAAIHAGIKPGTEKDMALLVSLLPADAAGAFTTNQVKAGPVRVSQQHLKNGKVRAVILNSGNANACTGVRGIADAKKMTAETALALKSKPHEILVCSTGRIGVPLPIRKVVRGIGSRVVGGSRHYDLRYRQERGGCPTDAGWAKSHDRCDGQGGRNDPSQHGDDALCGDDRCSGGSENP